MKKNIFAAILLVSLNAWTQNNAPCKTESELKIYPVLWQQRAAEYRALCYQAFNIATLRLNAAVKNKGANKKTALITDLDETILDNSYQQAELIKNDREFTNQSWKDWVSKGVATAVPGAVAFLQLAKQKGVSIFYISNRDTSEVRITMMNLKSLGLPDVDTGHMLFLSNTSSKETRRQIVMKKYNVVMLLGDNLNDFMQVFEKKDIAERFTETDKVKNEWGKKFIVLPNSTYGEWENAVYDYKNLSDLTPEQKEAMRREKLEGYSIFR